VTLPTATDPEGDAITYEISTSSSISFSIALESTTSTILMFTNVDWLYNGTYAGFKFKANDATGSDELTFEVTVGDIPVRYIHDNNFIAIWRFLDWSDNDYL